MNSPLQDSCAFNVRDETQVASLEEEEVGRHRGAPTHGGVRHEAQALWDLDRAALL